MSRYVKSDACTNDKRLIQKAVVMMQMKTVEHLMIQVH